MPEVKWNKAILIYGASLALLLLVLKYFEYRYFIGSLSTEIYLSVIAVLFTAFGIWVGLKLVSRGQAKGDSKSTEIHKIKLQSLNKRESEILACIEKGMTNKEISEVLFIAIPTVKTHVSNLLRKLEVKNRTQAVFKAKSIREAQDH